MNYLLDTNVISQLAKKTGNKGVVEWIISHQQENLNISCLTIGEIKTGILKLQKKDVVASQSLQVWLDRLLIDYKDQIITIDLEVCSVWAELMNIDCNNAIDSLIAAQAITKNMILVTRNIKHFKMFNIKLLDPFEEIIGKL